MGGLSTPPTTKATSRAKYSLALLGLLTALRVGAQEAAHALASFLPLNQTSEQTVHLISAECGTFSEGDAEGWRAYTGGRLEGEDPDPFVVSFCPECAEREFRSFIPLVGDARQLDSQMPAPEAEGGFGSCLPLRLHSVHPWGKRAP
jgi:hypothetical protein